MPVNTTHPDYSAAKKRWDLTRAAAEGLDADSGKLYISRRTAETQEQYDNRVAKAIYANFTGRTLEGFAGAVFRNEPNVSLPNRLKPRRSNFDATGSSVAQVARQLFDGVMLSGRTGILVDFPQTGGTQSIRSVKENNLRAYAAIYDANSIINHRYEMDNGKIVLKMVTLQESIPKGVDEFTHTAVNNYRVLRLTDGIYTQQMYDENQRPVGEEIVVKDGKGKTFDHIAFHFIGSKENTPNFDKPSLYDIGIINIGHYRNSADHENNLSVHGAGTLVITTSMSKEEFDTRNPGGLILGENSGVLLEQGDSAKLLQLDSAQAIGEEMESKESRMQKLGAKIIDKATVNRTAEAARIDASSETSLLETAVGNINDGMTSALRDLALFEGVELSDDEKIALNKDFWFNKLEPQFAMALIQLNDAGALPKEHIVEYLKESDLIPKHLTYEDVIDMLNTESPI